jgi:hypothetical protein
MFMIYVENNLIVTGKKSEHFRTCGSSGTHPDSFQWVSGVIFKRVKWIWCKAGVQNAWSNASIPPICLYIMYRDILTFTIFICPLFQLCDFTDMRHLQCRKVMEMHFDWEPS